MDAWVRKSLKVVFDDIYSVYDVFGCMTHYKFVKHFNTELASLKMRPACMAATHACVVGIA
jgi:hypothetical protein